MPSSLGRAFVFSAALGAFFSAQAEESARGLDEAGVRVPFSYEGKENAPALGAEETSAPPVIPHRARASNWYLSTELSPVMSLVLFHSVAQAGVTALDADSLGRFGLAGIALKQSFGYNGIAFLNFSGSYSESVAGITHYIYEAHQARARIYDLFGELAFPLAVDSKRSVRILPVLGFAMLEVYMKRAYQYNPSLVPWERTRYYGPLVGIGLQLQPTQSFALSAKTAYVMTRMRDKGYQTSPPLIVEGTTRRHTVLASMRFDYKVSKLVETHMGLDYQAWSAGGRYQDANRFPSESIYLRRLSVSYGVRLIY